MQFLNITLNLLNATAKELIAGMGKQTIWCFEGEMGAGKTTFIKEICTVLGVEEEITSPTFSLVNEYKTVLGTTIYHFDFYRIRSIEEVYDIGYEDYFFSNNICLIEWPSKIKELLEGENIATITIQKQSEIGRNITVDFSG